jgi:hypothetical protein
MYRRRSSSTTPLTFFFWAFFLAQILTVNQSFCNFQVLQSAYPELTKWMEKICVPKLNKTRDSCKTESSIYTPIPPSSKPPTKSRFCTVICDLQKLQNG